MFAVLMIDNLGLFFFWTFGLFEFVAVAAVCCLGLKQARVKL